MNRSRLICGTLMALSACSDVQTVQLGELAGARAGVGSVSWDAAVSLPSREADAGAAALPPTIPSAGHPTQPSAADAGAQKLDAGTSSDIDIDIDGDGDGDEDSEESPDSDRSRADEDAGEPSDD